MTVWKRIPGLSKLIHEFYPGNGLDKTIAEAKRLFDVDLTPGQVRCKAHAMGLTLNAEVRSEVMAEAARRSTVTKKVHPMWSSKTQDGISYEEILARYYPELGAALTKERHLPLFNISAVRRKASLMGLKVSSERRRELALEARAKQEKTMKSVKYDAAFRRPKVIDQFISQVPAPKSSRGTRYYGQ